MCTCALYLHAHIQAVLSSISVHIHTHQNSVVIELTVYYRRNTRSESTVHGFSECSREEVVSIPSVPIPSLLLHTSVYDTGLHVHVYASCDESSGVKIRVLLLSGPELANCKQK